MQMESVLLPAVIERHSERARHGDHELLQPAMAMLPAHVLVRNVVQVVDALNSER